LREIFEHAGVDRQARVAEVTLLLCDIRGFTRISERMSPQETVAFVNSYLDTVCPLIVDAGGVIDKFMGDGVLAFFEGGGHAARALGSARRILHAVARTSLLPNGPLRVGVALHTGQVLVGAVGPRSRREHTVISDAVNIVSRLEELNKTYGSVVVASDATIAAAGAPGDFEGPLTVTVRGREAPVAVHILRA
jgi:adenylate cyclase